MLTALQRQALLEGAALWGITLNVETLHRFALFVERLYDVNQSLNLTRVPIESVVPLHLLDSLSLVTAVSVRPGMHLLDVGTGAGFPGIPLALAFPELDVTLLDSTRKRLAFLETVIQALFAPPSGPENSTQEATRRIRTLHARAEELASHAYHREAYDLVTARAVAKMEVLAGWMLPFVKPGGYAVAYKSREADNEIEAARPIIGQLGGVLERVVEVTIPGMDIPRKLAVIRKTKQRRG